MLEELLPDREGEMLADFRDEMMLSAEEIGS